VRREKRLASLYRPAIEAAAQVKPVAVACLDAAVERFGMTDGVRWYLALVAAFIEDMVPPFLMAPFLADLLKAYAEAHRGELFPREYEALKEAGQLLCEAVKEELYQS